MTADKELWLCRSSRTNHAVFEWKQDGPCRTLCDLFLVVTGDMVWTDAKPWLPLCVRCQAVAQQRFRKTHPREQYVPAFMKRSQ